MAYLTLLSFTLAWELPIVGAYAALRRGPRVAWMLVLALAANLTSHGLFFMLFPGLPGAFAVKLTLAELAITAFEGGVYTALGRLRWWEGLALSLVANLASLLAGIWLR